MQRKLSERQKLLSQLDQAKMQEQVNAAMSNLNEQVGQEVPTLDEVRQKIEARYAKALGTAELSGQSVEARMLEVEQAHMNSQAQARLDAIRAQLGISPAPSEAPAVGTAGSAGAAGAGAGGASAGDGGSAGAGGSEGS
jgi:phage shock protein A